MRNFSDQREKVLFEKERKKKEEQVRWEEQFRAISMENYHSRKIATEKKNAQYRPSNAMKSLIASYELIDETVKEEKAFKIQEDYDMNEESNGDDEIILGKKSL